ncbi:MAG: hypothetical protein K0Q74_1088 [Gammaproteobacteria bacterium]|jgi:hypothetical protein|nr:hypothetical protein [Gammaproteobacteria bacterium]
MIYTSQYDEGLYESDSLCQGIGDTDLERVFESNDFSYIMDLDDV